MTHEEGRPANDETAPRHFRTPIVPPVDEKLLHAAARILARHHHPDWRPATDDIDGYGHGYHDGHRQGYEDGCDALPTGFYQGGDFILGRKDVAE